MKNKKKAEISQMFTYISTAIVIVIIIGFGVMWLYNLLTNVKDIECIQFKKNLELKIRNNIDYGKIDNRPIRVDCDFRQICFITDPIHKEYSHATTGDILDVFINDTLKGNVKQNVFFINQIPENFFYLEKLVVNNNNENLLCFNVTRLGIQFKLEGRGNHVLLSKLEN